jgi:serine protease AprX
VHRVPTSKRFLLSASLFATLGASLFATPAVYAGYDPSADAYSMRKTTTFIGARQWWSAGYTGKGVDVALIDSGVSPVKGLDGSNKLAYGPDLSFESQSPQLRNLDTFGHGTFMAGLIAGNDDPTAGNDPAASVYRGVAPGARIVSLKVATADGGTDVSQVIAAIDWVVQHRNDPGMNIRVLSLSYGTNSTQKYGIDPLAYAAERAWKAGIVVVAAAGNTGYQRDRSAPGLADPAYDPYVIAVGGYDSNGTATTSDDVMGAYSASASVGSAKNPDFVAVGSHVQGLRVPGSYIDQTHPEGLISDRFFRGSGTSEATAIAACAVALILQKYPSATPDAVKRLIAINAKNVPGTTTQVQGGGEIALSALASKAPVSWVQTYIDATGTGSLELSRGSDHVSMDGVALTGEQDIFGHQFDSSAMATLEANGRSWTGGTWNGSAWAGDGWTGTTWDGRSWSGRSWTGRSWSTLSWSGNSWDGRSWSGRSWTGNSFSGGSWSGRSWSGGSWQ